MPSDEEEHLWRRRDHQAWCQVDVNRDPAAALLVFLFSAETVCRVVPPLTWFRLVVVQFVLVNVPVFPCESCMLIAEKAVDP
jgi:hypothetical protein